MKVKWFGLTLAVLLAVVTACAPRQIRPVAAIDASPLLANIEDRRSAVEMGLSGTLEMAFRNGEQRFKGTVYIVVFPDGQFRIEVPGLAGSTLLVMTSDNREILAYYPRENKAYRSAAGDSALNPYLPFPLPVNTEMLPALLMGVFPDGGEVSGVRAYLMDSGEKRLWAEWGQARLQFTCTFKGQEDNMLREIRVKGNDLEVEVRMGSDPMQLPSDFTLTFPEGTLKGAWDTVGIFSGDRASLALKIPGSVPVRDLGTGR